MPLKTLSRVEYKQIRDLVFREYCSVSKEIVGILPGRLDFARPVSPYEELLDQIRITTVINIAEIRLTKFKKPIKVWHKTKRLKDFMFHCRYCSFSGQLFVQFSLTSL